MKSHIPLWFAVLGAAHAVPVQTTLTLVENERPNYNRLNVTMAPPSPMPSDTDTTDLTGTLSVVLDIDPATHQTTVMTLLSTSRVHGTSMNFTGSIFLIGQVYNINVTNMSAGISTQTPPGTVNPATGQFAADQHKFKIDQGNITGSAAGNDVNGSFSSSNSVEAVLSGSGSVTLSNAGVSGRFRNYNVTVVFPANFSDNFNASGNNINVNVAGHIKATGTVQVPIAAADIVWTGALDDDWEAGGKANFSASGSPTPFFNGDSVTFNDSSPWTNVRFVGPVAPGGIVFDHDQNYTLSALSGASEIAGSTGLVKKGTGTLTLGGDGNSFTGPVSIQAGILRIGEGSGGALGDNIGDTLKTVTISSGAQFDLNGQSLSGTNSYFHYHIAGAGPDGFGAITNSHATGYLYNEASGIRNLTLTADASIGGNAQRFDVGFGGELAGAGGTRVLTKVGTNGVGICGPASNIEFVIAGGRAWVENSNNGWGGAAGKLTVQNGARAGTWANRTIATPVFIEDGGTLYNEGGGTGTWTGAFTLVSGSATINTGGSNQAIVINGKITGAGGFSKTGNNILTLGGAGSDFTGPISVTDSGSRLTLGSDQGLGHASGITIANNAQINLNGRRPGNYRQYTVTINGTGTSNGTTGGRITNSSSTNISNTQSGIQNLILTGNAFIGGNAGRLDVASGGSVASSSSTTRTLTKVGSNRVGFLGPATRIRFVIEGGESWAENDDNAWGGAGGLLTIKNGARAGTYGNRTIATPVIIEDGGTLRNIGGASNVGISTWTGPFTVTGNVTIDSAHANSPVIINGPVTGTANLTKISGNTATIAQPGWVGNTTVSAGTLSIGQPTLDPGSTVSIDAGAVLNLNFEGENHVSWLFIGGVPQPIGIYNSSHSVHGARFTGTGSLVVRGATFTFRNNDPEGTGTPFDPSKPAGVSDTQYGLTLTSVEVKAPTYVKQGSEWIWDGTSFHNNALTNVAGSSHSLGVDNQSPGSNNSNPISSDNGSFHPGESWTIAFDRDVVIDSVDIASFDGSDQMRLESGANVRNFTSGIDASPFADPFNGLVIPAGAPITITNTNAVATPLPDGGTSQPGWRIAGITVKAVIEPPASSGYDAWAAQISNPELNGFDQDADGDGIPNGLEYVLRNGDPNAPDSGILPLLDATGEETVEFVFYRNDDSTGDTIQTVQYGGDLSGWTDVPVNAANPPSVAVEDQGGGVSKITVTIPKLAPSLFVRLKVTQPE